MDWVAALLTIPAVYFTGQRRAIGPVLGVLSFLPWAAFTWETGAWGLMAINAVMLVVYTKLLSELI